MTCRAANSRNVPAFNLHKTCSENNLPALRIQTTPSSVFWVKWCQFLSRLFSEDLLFSFNLLIYQNIVNRLGALIPPGLIKLQFTLMSRLSIRGLFLRTLISDPFVFVAFSDLFQHTMLGVYVLNRLLDLLLQPPQLLTHDAFFLGFCPR